MSYRNFNDIPHITLVIVLLTGLWGAIMNFARREELKRNISVKRKIAYFLMDLITSGGIAVIVFLGLVGYGFNELFAVAFAGIMSHQGTRAMYLIELVIAEKLNSKALRDAVKKENKDDR